MGQPALLSGNRAFHRVLVSGVPVQYQLNGETRGDFVRLVDWHNTASNEWLAVQHHWLMACIRKRELPLLWSSYSVCRGGTEIFVNRPIDYSGNAIYGCYILSLESQKL